MKIFPKRSLVRLVVILANSLGPKCAPFVQLELIEAFHIKSNKFLNFIWFFIYAIDWKIPLHFDQGIFFSIGLGLVTPKGNNVSSKVNIDFFGRFHLNLIINWSGH